ncbi:MAG: hypothetical protein LUD17_11415 [Bacteroidales bacterium]|nr:hypothetical protein [Bacteroidales bacterium]
MKKIMLCAIALMAMCLTVSAQTKMVITKTDQTRIEIDVNDIDVVTFEESAASTPTLVDLGLPSGLLWAQCNLGADAEEDCGYYYAWGEIAPHPEGEAYTEDDYSDYYFDEMPSDISGDPAYDAATAAYGEGWAVPTPAQQMELMLNTTATFETLNNVDGVRFTAENGNSVFFPLAGRKTSSDQAEEVGLYGMYWSGLRFTMNIEGAYIMYCAQAEENTETASVVAGTGTAELPFMACPRVEGLPIRPVYNQGN